MNCTKCNSECSVYKFDNIVFYYCIDCWDFIYTDFTPCENHQPTFVKFTNGNGSKHLKKQCFNCGRIESPYYKKDIVEDFESLPEVNDNLADLCDYSKMSVDTRNKVHEIYDRYQAKSKQYKREKLFDEFIKEHDEYLKTDDWKYKRELVLKRDNSICQSCLEKKATQVHHKSYRYWKNEPLFELVSVCCDCHDKITQMNRNMDNYNKINMKL